MAAEAMTPVSRPLAYNPALAVITVATCAWLLIARTPIREWFAGLLGVLTYSADVIDVSGWGDSVGGHWSWAWSLSVEEQFYLLWPALLLLVFRGGTARWSRHRFALVALLVVAAAWLSRAQMVAGDASRDRIKYSFDSNMDALAWGALLALVVTGRSASPRVRRAAGIVAPVAAAMFAVEVIHPQWVRGVLVFDANALGLVALTSVVLVAGVVIAPRSPFWWGCANSRTASSRCRCADAGHTAAPWRRCRRRLLPAPDQLCACDPVSAP